MMHDENTAMERSYHPTGAELWFLLSLLDDRPAPLFWPMGEPAENWPLVAVPCAAKTALPPLRRWPRCWTP